ncbi:MAG: MFS transporter [Chloroflexota bacterium]|nr:MFS transporter [Chloroflexota bacterium]
MTSALSPRQKRAYEANVWKFYVHTFLLNFQLWWPIWIIYLQEERGLSLGQITLMDVPFWLSIIILQIPAAAAADRWGRKPALMLGALLWAAAVTVFGLADTYALLLLSYLIWGVAIALLTGADSAFLYDSLKALGREGEYQKLYGGAWAIISAAGLAGTLIGAPLAAATSLPLPIVLSGGIAFLGVLAAATFTEPAPEVRADQGLSYTRLMRESLQLVARQANVRYAILFFGIVVAIGSIAPIFFFQPFLVHHGISLGQMGFWQTPARIMGILGALITYRVVATLGKQATFYLMPIVLVASYALLAAWDSVYAQVSFPVMTLVAVMARPAITDYLNQRVPTIHRATIISLTNLMYSLLLIPIAPVLGAIADQSLAAAFWAGAAILGVGAIAILPLWTRAMARERLVAEEERVAL